jgi:threonine/homoserine/homoserine lactone efflux protein
VNIAVLPIGVTIGLVSSIPLGPINLTLIAAALRREMPRGVAIALSAALIEGVYAFAIISALNLFHPSLRLHSTIELIGALIIVTYGVSLLFSRSDATVTPDQTSPSPARRDWSMGVLTGVALYVSNPALVVFWRSVAGILNAWVSSTSSAASRAIFSAGVVCGTASWFILLLYMVQRTSARISLVLLRRISILLSCFLIAFGGHMLVTHLGGIW